jgi:hypothetical protein
MAVVRQFLGRVLTVGLLCLTTGCLGRRPTIQLAIAPHRDSLPRDQIAVSLFLIGDAGAAKEGDAVLDALTAQGKAAPRGSAIVFLGDNVYPRGIPVDTSPDYVEAKRRLLIQAAVADSTGLRLIFVPGNHDWDRHRETGWAQVQRQGNLLRQYAEAKKVPVELLPRGGCPGPAVVQLGAGLRLVAIDTQWWLHSRIRPGFGDSLPDLYQSMPDPDWRCSVSTQERFLDSLKAILPRSADAVTVLVGHHPLESHGEHGGHLPWVQYVFPLVPTPVASWFWVPIGWIYPLGRRLVKDRQDAVSSINRAMRRGIEGTFTPAAPLVYASGHDHSLEVIRRGADHFYLVSGSGMEDHQSSVRGGDSTAFASDRPGFMRLDLLNDGRVRLGVTVIDDRRRPVESYRAWLRLPNGSRRSEVDPE